MKRDRNMIFKKKKNIVNMLRLSGIIANKGKKNLSLKNLLKHIDKAFNGKNLRAVGLIIDSPGGSPVQSDIIANYLIKKSQEKKVELISFVEDIAASGGYWLACAGIEIYATSKSSIVGSIGVIAAGFGFKELIKRYGIERRVYTAGKSKSILDPFTDEKPEDITRLKEILVKVHQHFKDFIKNSRKNKLKLDEEELFSGAFWVASEAIDYGLIDGIEDYFSVLQRKFGQNVKINYIEIKQGFFCGLFSTKKIILELDNSTTGIMQTIHRTLKL